MPGHVRISSPWTNSETNAGGREPLLGFGRFIVLDPFAAPDAHLVWRASSDAGD